MFRRHRPYNKIRSDMQFMRDCTDDCGLLSIYIIANDGKEKKEKRKKKKIYSLHNRASAIVNSTVNAL